MQSEPQNHNPEELLSTIAENDWQENPQRTINDGIHAREEQPTPIDAAPTKSRRKKPGKKIGLYAGLGLLAVALIIIGYFVFSPHHTIKQVYLVPKDATFIIQSSEPVKDWKKFSASAPWQCLKQAGSFAEINENIDMLDSIVHANNTLLSLVGKRDLLISLHKSRTNDWDFLILIDLKRISKMKVLQDQVEQVIRMTGNPVNSRVHESITILEMPETGSKDVLHMAFIDNHFAVSYSGKIIEAAIEERHEPQIGVHEDFLQAEDLVSGKGICRLFVNYAYLPQFMSVYLGGNNEYIDQFSKSMNFAGLYFDSDKEKMEVRGYTLMKDISDPYTTAFLKSGKHKMKAHEILSARTAFYTNIGFDNASAFMKELEKAYQESDQKAYEEYISARDKIEKFFDISLEENFLSWMSGEFALTQSEPGLLGNEPDYILAIRAKSMKSARKNLEYIEKRIKRRSPVKIKTVNYKGYEINYMEMKGFFRLFFGSLFDRFEKPYYTYVGDYVVFSNKSSSLLSFVEDYEQKNLLKNDPGFKKTLSRAKDNNTLFTYIDIQKFYPLMKDMVNADTWKDFQQNREILYSFPHWTMQVVSEKNQASMQLVMDYKLYEAPDDTELMAEVEAEDKEQSNKELMNELKRFYVEKFQGNVLRDYYGEGVLKSEAETKEGVRHGRYREFHENGKLRLRGRYVRNEPRGVWKYYTEDGKFDRKERFK